MSVQCELHIVLAEFVCVYAVLFVAVAFLFAKTGEAA